MARSRAPAGRVDLSGLLAPGEPIDLDNCAREPIHIPGAIQPHGALLVVRLRDGEVVQASENAPATLGSATGTVLGSRLEELLGAEADTLLAAEPADVQVSTIVVSGRQFDALAYGSEAGFRVVELESAVADNSGDSGEPASALDVLAVLDELWGATDAEQLLQLAAATMRRVTGHERIWAYRFEDDGHGVIVAEAKSDHLESFLGLHFPESDIPAQARALYLRNGIRTIVDAQAPPVAVMPVRNPDTDAWTDMSDGALRAVSPMHIAYLGHMGVRASISASIVVDGRLWGLLSGHHYEQPRRLGRQARALVGVIARLVGIQIDAFDRTRVREELLTLRGHQARLLECVAHAAALPEGLVADPGALLGICRASGAIIRVGSRLLTAGETPSLDRCAELVDALVADDDDADGLGTESMVVEALVSESLVTDSLAATHPEFADISDTAAGALVVPLSRRHGNVIVWLRPEQVSEVTWGNAVPSRGAQPAGVERLTPHGSFEQWKQTVRLRSRPWQPEELASAHQLRSSLGNLLLTRAETLSRSNVELSRVNAELDAFAYTTAHDLREPLRAINSLATFLIEDYGDTLEEIPRDRLARLVAHARRMAGLLDSLLDYATLGRTELGLEEGSVLEVAREAAEVLIMRTEAAGVQLRYGRDAKLRFDRRGLLEVFTNLVDNALKYTDASAPVIEFGVCDFSATAMGQRMAEPTANPLAEGPGPSVIYVADNGIGIAPDDRAEVFRIFRRLHSKDAYGGGSGAGLTIAQRIVQRHGGRMWIEDGIDGGTGIYFTVAS